MRPRKNRYRFRLPPIATDGDTPQDDTILPYYNNYLKEYRLGPSDMISVEVFGQCPDYCKTGITIPPNARISYPLIREGILVAGKTVEQVAAEITKKLDEYIIDPKVTVTLDRAMATRYAVMGNVATPGIRVMDRKVSVYEAILEAGGLTRNGDRNKVFVVSYGKDERLSRKLVDLTAMETGKADMIYLNPGDQIFVGGKGFTLEKFLTVLGSAGMARTFIQHGQDISNIACPLAAVLFSDGPRQLGKADYEQLCVVSRHRFRQPVERIHRRQ